MNDSSPPLDAAALTAMLQPAYRDLDDGRMESARAAAQQVLALAQGRADRSAEAEALLCLAVCDRLSSRFRRSHEAALRAARLFHALGDAVREVAALTTSSYAAVALGYNEEAVESCLLAVRLGADAPATPQYVLSLNYLGVAYLWSRDFDRADQALEASVAAAEACTPPASTFQPRVNLTFSRLLRAVSERHLTGTLPPLDRLDEAVVACTRVFDDGERIPVMRGIYLTGRAMWPTLLAVHHAWNGRAAEAAKASAEARSWMRMHSAATWLNALVEWADAERRWALGDGAGALQGLVRTREVANRLEHEQLAMLTHGFASHLCFVQGRAEQAVEELLRLQRRELRVRIEGLASRARAVNWQIAMRDSERDVRQLRAVSQHFEQMALEDPLTGMANRRRIHQRLQQLIEQAHVSGPPWPSVALIDVDRFKTVNDRFSHQVGDRVLAQVARLLVEHVRGDDLVGRLAGDEFVVLFMPRDAAEAEAVCRRLGEAVAGWDWSALAEGLAVTVSIGVSEIERGDDPEAALHRSDLAMYRSKWPPTAAAQTGGGDGTAPPR